MIISVTAGLDFSAYAETTHLTSTNSLYSDKFQSILDELKSTKYYDSMYNSFVCIIPGIEQTNTGDGTYSNYKAENGKKIFSTWSKVKSVIT